MNTPILTLNFRDETIMLNESALESLGRPKQIQIMISNETKRLAMCPCDTDSEEAVVMPPGDVRQFEIGGRSVLKKIRKAAGWQSDLPRLCFGEAIPDHRAVCFDLEYAVPVEFGTTAVNAFHSTAPSVDNAASVNHAPSSSVESSGSGKGVG